MSTGRPLKRVPDDLARKVAQQIAEEDNSDRHFAALKRILDREEPDYAE
jgi:predicted transcriptional regulator